MNRRKQRERRILFSELCYLCLLLFKKFLLKFL